MVAYLSLMTDEVFARIPPYRGEPLLAALFGGVLVGAGLGLILMRGSSTGGTDIIVKLIQMRKPYLSLGRIVLATDLAVVLLAAVVYRNIETILYGAVMIYASTEMIDGLIDRADARKLAIIVTGRGNETARALMGELRRGVTVLPATGAYTGETRSVLLCVVEIRQLFELKRLVGRIDPGPPSSSWPMRPRRWARALNRSSLPDASAPEILNFEFSFVLLLLFPVGSGMMWVKSY